MRWRVTKRLTAVTDSGVHHTIVQMEKAGEIDFVLESGWAVTHLADGTFRIDEMGEILRISDRHTGATK